VVVDWLIRGWVRLAEGGSCWRRKVKEGGGFERGEVEVKVEVKVEVEVEEGGR
jgi:hypothetical protein